MNKDIYSYRERCGCTAYMMEGYATLFFNKATCCLPHLAMHRDDAIGWQTYVEHFSEKAVHELLQFVVNPVEHIQPVASFRDVQNVG